MPNPSTSHDPTAALTLTATPRQAALELTSAQVAVLGVAVGDRLRVVDADEGVQLLLVEREHVLSTGGLRLPLCRVPLGRLRVTLAQRGRA